MVPVDSRVWLTRYCRITLHNTRDSAKSSMIAVATQFSHSPDLRFESSLGSIFEDDSEINRLVIEESVHEVELSGSVGYRSIGSHNGLHFARGD